jgi:hypothetical protein
MTDKEISPASMPWNFLSNKNIYYTARTVPKSNQNIAEIEAKSIPLTHIYMTAQLSWLQYKVAEVIWFYGSKLPFLVK